MATKTAQGNPRWTRRRVQLICQDKSRAQQNMKAECDINNIVKRFRETGQLPHMINREARYGDFSDVGTYQDAINTVMLAQEQFDALPAATRRRFDNDPAKFLEFATDPKNQDELIKMGLATRREAAPEPESTASNKEAKAPLPKSPKGSPKAPSGSPEGEGSS